MESLERWKNSAKSNGSKKITLYVVQFLWSDNCYKFYVQAIGCSTPTSHLQALLTFVGKISSLLGIISSGPRKWKLTQKDSKLKSRITCGSFSGGILKITFEALWYHCLWVSASSHARVPHNTHSAKLRIKHFNYTILPWRILKFPFLLHSPNS